MRLTKEALSVSIVVRRLSIGAAPFGWEVHQADVSGPIHVAAERFASMEAAYQAGQARLKEFIPQRTMPPGVTDNRGWHSRHLGLGVYDTQGSGQDGQASAAA